MNLHTLFQKLAAYEADISTGPNAKVFLSLPENCTWAELNEIDVYWDEGYIVLTTEEPE